MMKPVLPKLLFLSIFCFTSIFPLCTLAQSVEPTGDELEQSEDEPPVPRVIRLSFVEGDVSFLRAQTKEWADAVDNLPLLAGDQLYAGKGARAEIQLGRGSYIRLTEKTALTITELVDTAVQFEITEGTAIIRVERLESSFGRFEVNTPNAALLLERDGIYRVNVRGRDESEVIVRQGGADVTTADGSFKVREGYRLAVDTTSSGGIHLALDTAADDWDKWSYDRDSYRDRTYYATSPDYVTTYETTYNTFYGVSDLSGYGTWTYHNSYGNCWVPRVSAGWAPYRQGQWLWVPTVGWTWLSSEPWGWAPYHYGRWVQVNVLGWAWVPGFRSHVSSYDALRGYHVARSYYRWRPALVHFFNCPTSRGDYVGWYPLSPNDRWRRPEYSRDRSHLQFPGVKGGWRRPANTDGITVQPVAGFTRPGPGRTRPEAAGRDVGEWLGGRARPGLPDIDPGESAAAPAWPRGEARENSRRPIRPPDDVIARPIVTRNRPTNPLVGESVPRERRIIVPRKGRVDLAEKPIERRAESSDESRGGGENSVNGERRGKDRNGSLRMEQPDRTAADPSSGRSGEERQSRPDRRSRSDRDENSTGQEQKKERRNDADVNRERGRRLAKPADDGNPSQERERRDEERRPPKGERPSQQENNRPADDSMRRRPERESGESRRDRPSENREKPPENRERVRQERESRPESRPPKEERRESRENRRGKS